MLVRFLKKLYSAESHTSLDASTLNPDYEMEIILVHINVRLSIHPLND
jgi:hypothetical protein